MRALYERACVHVCVHCVRVCVAFALGTDVRAYIVMAYVVMGTDVQAYIVMAYVVMGYEPI